MLARYNIHMKLIEKDNELGGKDIRALQQLPEYQDNKWVCFVIIINFYHD